MGETRARKAGRWALMLAYGAVGVMHLAKPHVFVPIVPPFARHPYMVVILTGIAELVGVIGLALPKWRVAAGWGLAVYAFCVWPANAWHAMQDLGHGTGLPLAYHATRLVLQPAIIWWALWASGAVVLRSSGAQSRD